MTPNKTNRFLQHSICAKTSALLMLGSMLVSSAVLADSREVVKLGNGVVVDSVTKRAFTLRPKAGIEAVDIVTGNTLWTSTAGDRPVSVKGSALLAQVEATKSGSLELSFLNAANGDFIGARSIAIVNRAQARVTDSPDTRFTVELISGSEPEHLYWTHSTKPVQGARLNRTEAPAQQVTGFLVADFSKRTVDSVSQPPEFKQFADYLAPMPAGASGKRALYSQDLNHIVASKALSAEDRAGSESGARYIWNVYTAEGVQVQSFESAVSFAPFVVVGDKLLYVLPQSQRLAQGDVVAEPMSLRAIDLTTGDEAFKVAIRDVRFRGPFPP